MLSPVRLGLMLAVPMLAAGAALCGDPAAGFYQSQSGDQDSDRPPAKKKAGSQAPATGDEEQPRGGGVRVMTLAEKQCRERHDCPMNGPCPACPR